jgi:hypothetical protein
MNEEVKAVCKMPTCTREPETLGLCSQHWMWLNGRAPRTPASCSPDVVERVARAIALRFSGGKSDNPNGAELEAARAAIEAMGLESMQRRVDAMRPVETAPKDGSYFLFVGSNFDGGMAVVHWDDGLDWWTLDDGKNPEIALRNEARLVGWLPLPRAALSDGIEEE